LGTEAEFSGRTRFQRFKGETRQSEEGLLVQEPGLQVRATILDHGEIVLAFALEERAHINVWRTKMEAMGLSIGPWLRAFKEKTLRGTPDDTLIDVAWRDRQLEKPASLPLGRLKKEIMKITSGRKIAYVVDCSFTDANIARRILMDWLPIRMETSGLRRSSKGISASSIPRRGRSPNAGVSNRTEGGCCALHDHYGHSGSRKRVSG
jgi:hypothetical protein